MTPRSSRPLLDRDTNAQQEDAAWDFFVAAENMFPARIKELISLPSQIDEHEDVDWWDSKLLANAVQEWAEQNHIFCPAIHQIAARIAIEGSVAAAQPSRSSAFGVTRLEKDRREIKLPWITAAPDDESEEEFLRKARKHYRHVMALLRQRGARPRRVKREIEHFRYLAAYLMGGYSWAEIAMGMTPFRFGTPAQSTVSTAAREAAALIGIAMGKKRGPRPGSRAPRRILRRR